MPGRERNAQKNRALRSGAIRFTFGYVPYWRGLLADDASRDDSLAPAK